MYKEDLLNRQDRLSYRILLDVYLHNGLTTQAAVSKRLAIPMSTMTRYLDTLTKRLTPFRNQQKIIFQVKDGLIQLQLLGNVTLDDLIFKPALADSDTVAILKYLYVHGLRFQNLAISNQLHMSEASFYRQIANVNALLAPFELVIRHGQLTGSLSQLIFFYFNFWRTIDEPLPVASDTQSVVATLSQMGIRLNSRMADRLQDWLVVSQTAAQDDWPYQLVLPATANALLTASPLLTQLNQELELKVRINPQLVGMFVIIHGEWLLSKAQGEAFFLKTNSAKQKLSQHVTQLYELLPILNKLDDQLNEKLWHILVVPFVTAGDMQIFNDQSATYFSRQFYSVSVQQVLNEALVHLKEQTQSTNVKFLIAHWDYLSRRLLPFFTTQQPRFRPVVTIGLALGYSQQVSLFAKKMLKRTLHDLFKSDIQNFAVGQSYDVVVANEHCPIAVTQMMQDHDDVTPVELITELGTQADYERIKVRLLALTEAGDETSFSSKTNRP